MACKKNGCAPLSDTQKQVLESLAKTDEPCGSKDIAATTGMEAKKVSCQLTALKKKGFISSPVRCKYAITTEGRDILQ